MSLLTSNNNDYHADRTRLSSSNLKMLLKDPQQFYRERILGQYEPQPERDAFSEGSFTHSLILEPTEVAQYAVFPGLRKAGKDFEAFKAANAGKTILSVPQVNRCESWAKAALELKSAVEMLKDGLPEHTMLGEILGVPVKVRTDWISAPNGYIMDVKTTVAGPNRDEFIAVIDQYGYALSAAMYCEVARQNYNKLFDFYFLAISKQQKSARMYKASSDLLSFGTAQMTKALVMYKKCSESGIWSIDSSRKDFNSINEEIEEI